MAIQGLRDVSGFTVAGQRPENWREGILLLFPNGDTPLTALTSVMRSESTDDPKYHWFEKVMSDQRLALGADLTTAATSVTLASPTVASELKVGHILYAERTGEVMRVTAVTAGSAVITVVRAYGEAGTDAGTAGGLGGVTIAVATMNPNLTIIGTAHEEGSSRPTGIAYDPAEKFNYTQIFRNTLEATRTAINTRLRTGDAIREAKREALQYHAIEMERAFWLGGRFQGTANGKPIRATEGFQTFMQREAPTRIQTVTGGALSLKALEGYLKDIFDYGSSEKVAFCGNRALLAIQQCLRYNSQTPYTITQGQKEFGMAVTRLVSPFGELVLKTHPLFNRMVSPAAFGTGTVAGDATIAVLDMEECRYRYLRNSDTQYTTNMQVAGDDQQVAGYLTECGLEFHHARTHFILKHVFSGVVDS